MRPQVIYRSNLPKLMAFLVIITVVGCTGGPPAPTQPPELSPTAEASSPTEAPVSSPTEPGVATSEPAPDEPVLYQDDFTNPTTGWDAAEFGGYFIGYHEPESYHIEIQTAHLASPVVSVPKGPDGTSPVYTDATIELAVQTVSGKTSTEGDYRYGLAFRQTGGNYYAFTISPTNKKWEVFKNAAGQITPLKDGIEEGIQGLDADDILRVDASGSNFSFYINDKLVDQVTDSDYPEGTVGLYAENLQNVTTHVHFNTLTIRNLEGPPPPEEGPVLYQDDFTNPTTRWDAAEFGGYFIGYHEPESYHIEIQTAHLASPVVSVPKGPDGTSPVYTDATIELAVQTVSGKTSTEGDYRYGLAFRQTGGNYYAFTISPTNKKWEVFKNAAGQITPLKDGIEEGIQGLDVDDILRVDASGSNFSFYINDKLVDQVTDSDYPEGTVGLYAENLQNVTTHVHFNTLTIRNLEGPPPPEEGPVLYQDDFTNPTTRWAKAEFGSYFIGYHEPESYHIEIQTAHLASPVVSIPKGPDGASQNYADATIELAVQTVSGKTSTEGDYRYGLAFRQTGGNYYAFTISPTNKKWEVFKISPGQITPLKDGIEEGIQGLDADDILRVDASGSNFSFYINDKLVDQVTDSDYPEGTVGLYAENLQNVTTHIHFNTITVRELNLNMTCTVPVGTVYVRRGPGQKYAQIGLLTTGQTVPATGISSNQWIQIIWEGSNEPGWVSYNFDGGQLSCTPSIDVFPVINP